MQSLQIWKICSLICMKYFLFWFFTSSILFILYHDYLNKRKRYFEKIFNWSSCLEFPSLNIPLPVCFLKHPCKQCSSPLNIGSVRLETCHIFSRFSVIISKPAIFLAIFNFTLITRHNITACDLKFRRRHSNKMLFWCVATTRAAFSLMTGLNI